MTKQCSTCKAVKSTDLFHKNKSAPDGSAYRCKTCVREYNQTDKVKAQSAKRAAKYRRSEKGKAAERENYKNRIIKPEERLKRNRDSREYTAKNIHKKRAQRAVNRAILMGDLCRPTHCEACNSHCEKPQGHHDDYNKPLEVRWMCVSCHRLWHTDNQAIQHVDREQKGTV